MAVLLASNWVVNRFGSFVAANTPGEKIISAACKFFWESQMLIFDAMIIGQIAPYAYYNSAMLITPKDKRNESAFAHSLMSLGVGYFVPLAFRCAIPFVVGFRIYRSINKGSLKLLKL